MTATKIVVTSVTKDSPGAGQVTIVGTYTEDVSYTQPQQQVTVGDFPSANVAWSRAMRLTNQALFCQRNGSTGVSLELSSWAKIAYALEETLTYAPRITTEPTDQAAVAGGADAVFTLVADSESTATYQWQYESKASNTVVSNNTEVSDGDTVTINGQAYRFKDTMAAAYDVKRHGTTADTTLANLIAAINGTGTPGTEYYAGTSAHPTVQADASVTSHTVTLRARTSGTAGNAYTLAKSATNLSVGGATFSNGGNWASATGTILGCVYTGDTTASLTCNPSTTAQSGTEHRCVVTNPSGTDTSASVTLTIT